MKTYVYTVRDSKAEAYALPFYAHTDGLALRMFETTVNSPDHPIGGHPEDYTLFKLGEFDTDRGIFSCHEPIAMGNGIEFLSPVKI